MPNETKFEESLNKTTKKIDDALGGLTPAVDANGNITPNIGKSNVQDFQENGFIVPPVPSFDGGGLPYTKVKSGLLGEETRRLIHWYVPEYGIIKMYINPQSIRIEDKKRIQSTRTKGGFTLQYWGEDLTTLAITGTTGSSGIEGINVLHELYRAEQYAFDGVGLSLAASNAAAAHPQITNQIASLSSNSIDNKQTSTVVGGTLASLLGSAIGGNGGLASKNIPSLAQIAFGIEMYYLGWIYRGYFTGMTVAESHDKVGLYDYTLNFTATQRRGY
jgi:hypothetical protein